MSGAGGQALRTARLAGVVCSPVVMAVAIVVAGARTPGYSHLTDTVSRLGSQGQPHALVERTGIGLYGLLVVAGAALLGPYAPSKERILAFAIAGYGVAAVVTGVLRKDLPDTPHTVESQLHVDAGLVGGALMLLAMALVAAYATRRATRVTAGAVLALSVAGIVVFRFTWSSATYGLVERALLAMAAVWLAVLAAPLLRDPE